MSTLGLISTWLLETRTWRQVSGAYHTLQRIYYYLLSQHSISMILLVASPLLKQASSVLALLASYRNTTPECAGTFQILLGSPLSLKLWHLSQRNMAITYMNVKPPQCPWWSLSSHPSIIPKPSWWILTLLPMWAPNNIRYILCKCSVVKHYDNWITTLNSQNY